MLRKDKHLQANLGKEIVCNLFKQVEKEKQIEGVLQEFDENKLILKVEGKEESTEIERKNIAKMKLKYHWN